MWFVVCVFVVFFDVSDVLWCVCEVFEFGSGNGWFGFVVLCVCGVCDV